MADYSMDSVVQIGPGVMRESQAGGRLVIYTLEDGSRATLSLWSGSIEDQVLTWPSDIPCLLMHDLRRCGALAFNTDMQRKLTALHHLRPELVRHTALILPEGLTCDVVRLFIRVQELPFHGHDPVQWEVFPARTYGLAWLFAASGLREWYTARVHRHPA